MERFFQQLFLFYCNYCQEQKVVVGSNGQMDAFTFAYDLFEGSSASSPTSDVINTSGGLFLFALVVHRGFLLPQNILLPG